MASSPPQEVSSPRSVGSSGSDSETESKIWEKISKIVFSMLQVGYLYHELGPKSIIDRLKSDETNSTLRSHVTRIRYLAKVLQHFDDVREPAAQPLIHALAYQTINYLQARAYTLDEDHKGLIFSILHKKKNQCDLTKIRCIAKSNIDPTLWGKDYETIEAFFFGKALQLSIDRTALNPGIESDLAKGQKLMLLNRFCRIHNISVSKMAAASPVEIYIEADPSRKMKPVTTALIEIANLYNKEPHTANLVRLWQELVPYFLCMKRIHIYTNIPDIHTASIQFCDFHVEKFISILHSYRNTFDACPMHCKSVARAADHLMQQWYILAAALSVTDSYFDEHSKNFFNAWWGFAIENLDFPALTLQLQKHYPEFLCHRKNEYPTYDAKKKLSELAFTAHEMLKYLDIDKDYDAVLHSNSTIFMFSITAGLYLTNRCSIAHEKVVEALSSAYYASSRLNTSKVQEDSWIYNFKKANSSKRATFIRECRKYLTLLSKMPEDIVARIGMIDLFSAYWELAHDLPNDPLPELTKLIPEISADVAYENEGVYFDALRYVDPFEDSLANIIKTLHVLKIVQVESPIAKTILQDFPHSFRPILERQGPFDKIDKQLTDHFASLVNNLKENRLTLSNSELRTAIRPIAFLWIEILRNTVLHHISDITETDREHIFQQLNELIEFCTPPVETDPISGLIEVAPWTFSILKTNAGNKIYNTDAPFARYINRILIQFINVRLLSSSDPLVNHYLYSFAQNLNRDLSWLSLYHKEDLRSFYLYLRGCKTKKLERADKHQILAMLKNLYLNWLEVVEGNIDILPLTAKKWKVFASKHSNLINKCYSKKPVPKIGKFQTSVNEAKSAIKNEFESITSQFENLIICQINEVTEPINLKKLEIIRKLYVLPAFETGLTNDAIHAIGKFTLESVSTLEFINSEKALQEKLNMLMSFDKALIDLLYNSIHLRVAFEELLFQIADGATEELIPLLNTFAIEWCRAASETDTFAQIKPFLPPEMKNVANRGLALIKAYCNKWIPMPADDFLMLKSHKLENTLYPFLTKGLKTPEFAKAKKEFIVVALAHAVVHFDYPITEEHVQSIVEASSIPNQLAGQARSVFDSQDFLKYLSQAVINDNPFELIAPLCIKLGNQRVLKENAFTPQNLQKEKIPLQSPAQIQLAWLMHANKLAMEADYTEMTKSSVQKTARRRREIKKLTFFFSSSLL